MKKLRLTHPEIESAELTCLMCPEQWEGKMRNGTTFYFRMRFGRAMLGFGDNTDQAVSSALTSNRLDICHSEEPYRGYFKSDEERNKAFAALYAYRYA